MGQSAAAAPTRTRWPVALILLGCGVIAAAHIGKGAPAIPALKSDLGVDDVTAGLMLASISLAAALFAYPLGRQLRRFEPTRVLVLALAWLGLLSIAGSFFTQTLPILLARSAESLGYLVVVLVVPGLLGSVATAADRRYVMAMWGTFMPLGTALALLVAPLLLATWGWQSLWIASGLSCLVVAGVVVAVVGPRSGPRGDAPPADHRDVAREITADPPGFRADLIRLALIFCLYAAMYLAVLGLLPTALFEAGTSIRFASIATGVAVLVNAPGNLLGARLVRAGAPLRRSVAIGAVGIAVSSWGIYVDHGSIPLVVASALAFSFISGFVPASLFAQLNRVGDPSRVPTATGALVQGSGVGQLLGPPALAGVLVAAGTGSLVGPIVITLTAAAMAAIAAGVSTETRPRIDDAPAP